MHLLRLFPVLLITLLILAACGGQPAAENVDTAPAAAVEETAMDDTAKDDMAETEASADTKVSDDTMDADDDAHAMDADTVDADTMDSDADDKDSMDGDTAEGDMQKSEEMAAESESTESDAAEVAEEPAPAVERPAWQQIALTDARTGEQFTLADHADKTVFVEPFATWCGNCRRQLGNVQAAHTAAGDDVLFVALSVEPNIANEALLGYADKEGFEYTFAAMPPEMLQELAAVYGQTIGNPPATPHFIIRPDGSTTDLVTGIEGSEQLLQQIQAAAG